MKKLIALGLLLTSGMIAVPTATANTVDPQVRVVIGDQDRQNRRNRRNRGNRDGRWDNRRNTNQGVVVRMEQRYVRIRNKVYREVYRSTYTRNGQLVTRQLIRRERMSRYDRYGDNDFRKAGIRFGIHFNF